MMRYLAILALALAVGGRPAAADPEPPWAQGVSEDKQDAAIKLFDEGNALFAQQAHAPALDKYKQALAIWDHPLIRFNLAVTLIRLDRILEAADELEQALRYGDKPFKPELYQQALDYQALLKGRVGYIAATCDQAGAHVMLDGKPWFDCPGTKKVRVMAGEHVLVGERESFLTSSQRVVVPGGATVTQKVKLVPLESAVILKYPYRRWIPWTTTAGGAAVAIAGLGFWLAGKNNMDTYQQQLETPGATGCPADLAGPQYSLLRQARDNGVFEGRLGISMVAAGSAVLVGGIVMVILNRPQRVLPSIELAPRGTGVSASIGWTY
jgi:hypothetical protein